MNNSEYPGNKLNLSEFGWINEPKFFSLENNHLTIITDPETNADGSGWCLRVQSIEIKLRSSLF